MWSSAYSRNEILILFIKVNNTIILCTSEMNKLTVGIYNVSSTINIPNMHVDLHIK